MRIARPVGLVVGEDVGDTVGEAEGEAVGHTSNKFTICIKSKVTNFVLPHLRGND